MLKSVYLGFRKVKVQRVTVVEFGMYDRSGNGVGRKASNNGNVGVQYGCDHDLSLIHI